MLNMRPAFVLTAIVLAMASNRHAMAVITAPSDISGNVLWLDASDTGTITQSGGFVSQWSDKSPAGNNFTQGTGGLQPVTGATSLNGLNTLSFSGTQHLLGPSAVLTAGDDDYTYFAVWNPSALGCCHSVYEQGSGGGQRSAILNVDNTYGFNGESNDRHDLVTIGANAWRTTDMEINNNPGVNNVRLYDNGNYFFGTTGNPAGLNINNNGTAVGKKVNVAGEYFQGQIAEIIVYDRVLTPGERSDVNAYLNSKYAFTNVTPGLVHRWSFNDGTANDSVGTANGTLFGGATIAGGRLQLDGVDDFMRSSTIGEQIGVKTLVVWVSPANLQQRAGGVLTLEDPTGADRFDSIVYGEATANRWMSGSDFFNRTQNPQLFGTDETVTDPGEVMIAIAYNADNSISIFRDGVLYGNYTKGALQLYGAGIGDVLIGKRHDDAGGASSPTGTDPWFAGFVNEARIYNVALTDADVRLLYNLGPNQLAPSVPEPASASLLLLTGLGLIGRRRRR